MASTTYLLLFRSVGGPVQLPFAELRAALTKAGFKHATTCINSGNTLVRSSLTREETFAKVAAICKKKFKYERPIFVPTAVEWEAVIKHDPFPKKAEGKHVHVVLLADAPKAEAIKTLHALTVKEEDLKLLKSRIGPYHVCYIYTPYGFGTSAMAMKFDKGIGVVSTARNWNTVLKMHELAQDMERAE